ncbi:MAG: hypothetical protein R3F17_14200 [Planctomycetota bacterium]
MITRLEGSEAVEIAVYREAGANIVEVAQRVRDAVFGTKSQQEKAAKGGSRMVRAARTVPAGLHPACKEAAAFERLPTSRCSSSPPWTT